MCTKPYKFFYIQAWNVIQVVAASIWCFDIAAWMIWVLETRSLLLKEENTVTIDVKYHVEQD